MANDVVDAVQVDGVGVTDDHGQRCREAGPAARAAGAMHCGARCFAGPAARLPAAEPEQRLYLERCPTERHELGNKSQLSPSALRISPLCSLMRIHSFPSSE